MPRKIIKTPGQIGRSPDEAAVNHRQAHAVLLALANPNKAAFLAGFFKTRKGQYAEGDRFLGIMVPARQDPAHVTTPGQGGHKGRHGFVAKQD
jgi:hypothetical protein